MVKIKSKRQELKKSQPEIADALQKDVPLISKFENYVCLPTPDDASKLVEILGCSSILDLYDEKDITFLNTKPSKKRDPHELSVYRLTADLPRGAVEWLTKENLQLLGYTSIREWVNDCFDKFINRIKKKKSRKDRHQCDKE